MEESKKEKVIGQDIDRNKVKLDVDKMKFRISVNGILIKDNKVLLSEQKGYYFFPGGGMEIDETIEEALIREFKEETGLDVKIKEILDCRHDFWLTSFSDEHCNMVLLYFLVEQIGGKLSSEGFTEYEKQFAKPAEWINVEKIKEINFYHSDYVEIIGKAVKFFQKEKKKD